MNNIETMKLALEALDDLSHYADLCELFLKETHPGKAEFLRKRVTNSLKAITALSQAINAAEQREQAQQAEPDYYGLTKDHLWMSITKDHHDRLKPEFRMACYTSPPPRQPEENK